MRKLALVLVLAVAFVATHATAAVLCKKKSGVIAVRSACKRKETQLDPDALGLRGSQGPKGDTGQQGTSGPQGPGLIVKDAQGTIVGALANPESLPGPLTVLRRTSAGFLRFQIPTTL